MMTETALPIKYAYDPESAESRFMQRYVFGKWRTLTELFGIAVMLLFLYFVVKIAMREYGGFFMQMHPLMIEVAPLVFWAGIVLGLVAAFMCGTLVNRLHDTIVEAEKQEERYNKGPIDVTLDAEGVHSTSKHWAQFVAWPTVHRVIRTPQGIGLRLDNRHFIPILADQLPEGMSTDDVLDQIEAWRGLQD